MHQLGGGPAHLQQHRGGELAQQGQGRRVVLAGQAHQAQALLGLVDHQQAGARPCRRGGGWLPLQLHRQGLPGLVQQAEGQGDHQGLLVALAGGRWGVLLHQQLQHAGVAIPVALDM